MPRTPALPPARDSVPSLQNRGSAMVMAIFVLFLLTSVGTALLFLSQNEVKMSQANLNTKRAFYLAEAGLEAGRSFLWAVNGLGEFEDDLQAREGANNQIDLLDPDLITPVFNSNGALIGLNGVGDDEPLVGITPMADGWFAAYLTNDPLEARNNTAVDDNERVSIIAVGASSDTSFEVVEAIVERRPLIPITPPATITILGPPPQVWTASSSVKDYVGEDCDGSGVADLYVPVVGTIGSDATAAAETGINANPDYTSGPYVDEETFADLTDADEETVQSGVGVIPTVWTDCETWKVVLENLRDKADVICSGFPCVFPDYGPSRLIFIDGDYDLRPGQSGAGTIVVTGTLTMEGRTSWRGLILVVGEGRYRLNGSGNGEVSGGMIVADIAGPDEIYRTADDCTGGDDGFGTATFDERGGGNALTTYCSTDLNVTNQKPYEIVDFVQR